MKKSAVLRVFDFVLGKERSVVGTVLEFGVLLSYLYIVFSGGWKYLWYVGLWLACCICRRIGL